MSFHVIPCKGVDKLIQKDIIYTPGHNDCSILTLSKCIDPVQQGHFFGVGNGLDQQALDGNSGVGPTATPVFQTTFYHVMMQEDLSPSVTSIVGYV